MYLSMLELDARYSSAALAIAEPDYLHKRIQEAFSAARKDHNVLYRLYDYPERKILYVQSDIAPDWGKVDGKGIKLIEARDINAIESVFNIGKELSFSVNAYPCKKNHGKKFFLREQAQQIAWFKRNAEKNGFEVVDINISSTNRMPIQRKGGNFVLPVVCFEGILKITDETLFKKGFREGFGAEKAFGCGMLMLKNVA